MVCFVRVKIEMMENRERKIRWKIAFFTVWLRRENKRDRKQGGNFPSGPIFFYPPNLGGKRGGKSAKRCTLYKYPQFKLHFFLSSLFPRQKRWPPPFFFFFFLGNNVASNVAPFFFFLSNHIASCHFFFSFDFLGLGLNSLYLFLLDVIFFLEHDFYFYKNFWVIALFCVVICHFF